MGCKAPLNMDFLSPMDRMDRDMDRGYFKPVLEARMEFARIDINCHIRIPYREYNGNIDMVLARAIAEELLKKGMIRLTKVDYPDRYHKNEDVLVAEISVMKPDLDKYYNERIYLDSVKSFLKDE